MVCFFPKANVYNIFDIVHGTDIDQIIPENTRFTDYLKKMFWIEIKPFRWYTFLHKGINPRKATHLSLINTEL